jgi:hypothetical protein
MTIKVKALSITLLSCLLLFAIVASPALAAFEVESFDGYVANADGSPATQAGAHPFTASTTITFTSHKEGFFTEAEGSPKDLHVELPQGFVGNPLATPTCPEATLEAEGCANDTQVGVANIKFGGVFSGGTSVYPIWNIEAAPGTPGAFGLRILGGAVIHIIPRVHTRPNGEYSLTVDSDETSQSLPLISIGLTFWGVPADSSHDAERGGPVTTARLPLLTNPTDCAAGPVATTLSYDSWQQPEFFPPVSFLSHDDAEPPNPIGVEECGRVPFTPSMSAEPTTTTADSPTGLQVDIHLPQEGFLNPVGIAEADLKKAVVVLPERMSVNPSSANGLGACTTIQANLTGEEPATCSNDSKIGSVEIDTPLIDHAIKGGVFLGAQKENPFGSLLATYIAVDDPVSGTVIKLPGKIVTDSKSGRVTATFDNNPQLPFEDLHVEFFGGPRAALVTPPSCGTYTTTGEFTPWSGTPPVTSTSTFNITTGPNGSACPNGSFNPKLEAGTTNPVAGKYSPFVLNLSREDGTQQLSTITAALPKGLLGKLAGIPYCSDSALGGIPTAEGTGAAQLANPSCPSASQLGTVSVGAGAGPSPFYVNTGKVYLAGPYKGAPLSLAIVTPALAGPFDLGNVVVRAALQVNPETTQITAVSDPLPTILQGIPLDLRSVAVNINREGFTLNPTSCNPMEVASTIGGTGGAIAHPSSRYQVGNCANLGFAPKLALNLKGGTTRAKNPALKAVLTAPTGQANIGKVQVILPKSVFIDSRHVNNPCTRVQFAEGAGNGTACPAKSILGKATAYSPLLAEPLKGNVYFRSNGGERKLPDLVASLNGQIHVNLAGFIDSVKQKGKEGSRVRNTFASVPDAPVSKFVLELQGGKKGLLQNSTNLCKTTNKATVKMDGQNGKVHDFETVVKPACGKKSSAKKPKKK